jgi:hypothetical protein
MYTEALALYQASDTLFVLGIYHSWKVFVAHWI